MFQYNDYALTLSVFFFFLFLSRACYLFLVRMVRIMMELGREDNF